MNTATTTVGTADTQVLELPLAQLHESPFNPRKQFDEQGLDELATDIRSIGRVLQPLLVRPRVPALFALQYAAGDASVVVGWEIVFGHRRFRAATMAELTTVPCMVRDMTDVEVKRAQISENLQRQDVHPIEEAEGFQALMADLGLSADDIAEQTGKSRSYVYGRLKLLQACPRVRDACLAGKIGSEVALLVARVGGAKLQEKALAFIDRDYRAKLDDGGKASFRAVRDLLNEKFTLQLKSAIFDTEDASLVASAGRCSSCPKRSGNAPEFLDIAKPEQRRVQGYNMGSGLKNDGPNVCTDPECFDAKKTAHLKRAAAALASQSVVVVTGNAARSAVSAHGEVKGNYIAASKVKGVTKAGTGKAVMDLNSGKVVPQLMKIQDPRTGKVHDAYRVADLVAAGVMKAEAAKPSSNRASVDHAAERRAREAKGEAETARRLAQWHALRAAARTRERDGFDLTLIVQGCLSMLDNSDWEGADLVSRTWGRSSMDALLADVPKLSRDEKALLLLDAVTVHNVRVNGYEVESGYAADYLDFAMAHYGIDPEQAAASGSTPSTAGASADDAAAGAGAHSMAADRCSGDELDNGENNGDGNEPESEGQAPGLQLWRRPFGLESPSSSLTPADAGGSDATAGATKTVPVARWPFPTSVV